MNPLHNPFSPGAGTPPPELAGRQHLLQQVLITLARIKHGRAEKSMIFVGLRGTGKTVLLHEVSRLAEKNGYQIAQIEADEKKSLSQMLLPELRRILFALNKGNVSIKVKRALGVLKNFVLSIKMNIKMHDVDFGIGIESEKGTADSGDLEADLAQVFISLGEAASDQQTAVAILIDELQYLSDEELSALIMAIHKISQKSLPVVLIAAGLPQLVGKAGRAKSYAERLFDYPELGPLTSADAIKALQEPAEKEGAKFTEEALQEIIRITQGYPYFLQEWGYQAWNLAPSLSIDKNTAHKATIAAIARLDQSFFRVRFDRLTPREKEYLRALAELGDTPQRSGDVADGLGMQVENAAPLRNNLIKKGMIYSPRHGDTAFTVPLFADFLKRAMPRNP